MMRIKHCSTDSDYAFARQITRDYMNWLNVDLAFQNVEKEFSEFRTMYGPPGGAYLLAFADDELAGGVGLRKLQAGVCEMKRLYVYDRFRKKGIGKALCEELIRHAKQIGYASMRLDTIDRLADAIRLYENLGFIDIESYRYNPDPTARFMELKL